MRAFLARPKITLQKRGLRKSQSELRLKSLAQPRLDIMNLMQPRFVDVVRPRTSLAIVYNRADLQESYYVFTRLINSGTGGTVEATAACSQLLLLWLMNIPVEMLYVKGV